MGWFIAKKRTTKSNVDFRPPSGDGLVLEENYPEGIDEIDFRPRLGMGWFVAVPTSMTSMTNFRLRLGMGWFGVPVTESTEPTTGFRPRVGMGWFYNRYLSATGKDYIFVPEWGWVGSIEDVHNYQKIEIFVPEWGWVGSADFNRNFKKSSNTI